MKKVRLSIETLRVDSFEAESRRGQRGTVGAYQLTHVYLSGCDHTCDDCPTIYSCNKPVHCA